MPALTHISTDYRQLRQRVAANLRAELASRRMTQRTLARRIGVSRMWVNPRLTGAIPLDMDDLEAICAALGVKPERMLLPQIPHTADVVLLPRQDSNLEPAGYGMQAEVGHAA